ncbi:DUF726-domain-containing protein [Mytilinidion resinicola]|uniref:DUF726-domain-containing protein n=1 Tax=Mytilinidion resinicola TaxID=574789 RepID=A0A6A6YDB7_9PEZI|nr:DUF726-domain-containing protein [Mytilinidion resinicola]KAF2806710.1 DUF726-domain-containing protein [Mytilinidion resinicola]
MSDEPSTALTTTPSTSESTSDGQGRPAGRPASPVELDDFGLPIRKPRRRSEVKAEELSPPENKPSSAEPQHVQNQSEVPSPPPTEAPKKEDDLKLQPNGHVETPDVPVPSNPEETLKPNSTKPPSEQDRIAAQWRESLLSGHSQSQSTAAASEWSHQQLAPQTHKEAVETKDEVDWQEMPAYAPFDMYNDDNKLVAREAVESDEETNAYGNLGGAAKGYTRVQLDEDAQSATSMDDNTAYLFKEKGTELQDDDDEARDPLAQMQTTKGLLTEGQRIAYVGLARLAMVQMEKDLDGLEKTKGTKKEVDLAVEHMKMWSQKMMVRLYSHMDLDAAEQVMIEQLSVHGVEPSDLTPTLMQNSRVKNPVAEEASSGRPSVASPRPESVASPRPESILSPRPQSIASPQPEPAFEKTKSSSSVNLNERYDSPPPPYIQHEGDELPEVRMPSQLPNTKNIDIDLRWTILCDLFLTLIADSMYDSRSRQLLEQVGSYLDVPWLEICRFEKRVTDALEMQEAADKENWNEDEHMANRKKMARNRRLVFMGLATVGGSLVIGLSAGLLAPVIGAGLAAGFTTIGVAGTGGFLAGAGGAAIVTTTGVLSGGTVAVRAANRRTGAVKTFEYRPLHNNKRVNLIVTISGWMNGKIDDVRLPYSTVDPVMGDIYSVFWEPEMLQSMGDTINILATEALTQGLQQVLGSTILTTLMGALTLPIVLTKLSYLIDNPWTVSQARADAAGLILADSLIDRNLGSRPITLVGFSLGSRVIIACLRELARKGAYGLVQNVYLFGTPLVAKKDDYVRAKSVVPGRFVNGYATNDWILGYLFRATGGGISRVAGLAAVDVPGIENINVTEIVKGHMAYRAAMPKLLREVGWLVESDEFTEIEDPDPENHEKRQRELINEIEEARKELEKKPDKKRFGFFSSKKKAEKKEWETYDDRMKASGKGEGCDSAGGVLFDIDAIRAEAAALAAEGIEVKQLESTLPPMKLDINASSSSSPYSTLRETKSFNDSIGKEGLRPNGTPSLPSNHREPSPSNQFAKPYDEYDEYDDYGHDEGNVSMTFDTSFKPSPTPQITKSPSLAPAPAFIEPPRSSWNSTPEQRPPLRSAATTPNVNLTPDFNAWADDDDDDFGKEKEMKMTFE